MVSISKRGLLAGALGLAAPATAMAQAASDSECTPQAAPAYDLPVAVGPFMPEMGSLKSYQAPDWFRDAKFGIWAHWGPQAVPRRGDWYARLMYIPGTAQYEHHLKTYGHPSTVG